jgi:regulation of enolase protein 1 (concanavalin A-like superfamily)
MNSEEKFGTLWDRSAFRLWAASLLLLATGAAMQISGGAKRIGVFEDHSDVGVTIEPGSAAYDSKSREYTVTGGGANMWGTADAFHFVWKRVSGDVTLSAGISLQGTEGNAHRKAGVMIRQGLGPSDAYADAVVHADGLTSLQYREKESSETLEVRAGAAAPRFLRLERRGNSFTLFVADADRHFTQAGSATVVLRDPIYVGLVVCAHDADALQTATFRDVGLKARAPRPLTPPYFSNSRFGVRSPVLTGGQATFDDD